MHFRAITLLLVFSTQALAAGLTSVVHLCSQQTRPNACPCAHGKKAQAKNKQTPPFNVQKGECCKSQVVRGDELPPLTQHAAPDTTVAAPVTPVVAWLPLPGPVAAPVTVRWTTATPAQGPPVYLQLRALLN